MEHRHARWVVGLSLAALLAVLYVWRDVFLPLLGALAFAYVLEPLVARLVLRGLSRTMAVTVVFSTAGAATLALFAFVVVEGVEFTSALTEAAEDQRQLARGFENMRSWVREQLNALSPELGKAFNYDRVQPLVTRAVAGLGELGQFIGSGVAASVAFFGMLLLFPVYLFYLMLELPQIWRALRSHLPAADRDRSLRVLGSIHEGLSAFLRGRVVIAVLKGVLTALGLQLCGVPFAWVVGMGAGVLSILPFVGAFLGYAIALGLALAQGVSWDAFVGVSAVFAFAELIEGFVLTPWVLKGGVSMHPLTILVSVVFWGAALGFFGALVAIPLTLVLRILLREYVLPSVDTLAAEGPASSAAPPQEAS